MKKALSLVLIVSLLLGVLPAYAEALPADDLTQHRSMTAFLQMDDYQYFATKDESPVVRYLMDKFNFSIEFQQPPVGSESEGFPHLAFVALAVADDEEGPAVTPLQAVAERHAAGERSALAQGTGGHIHAGGQIAVRVARQMGAGLVQGR